MSTRRITSDGEGGWRQFVITSTYDPSLTAAIKALPDRAWDGVRSRWMVPWNLENIRAVHAFAKEHGFTYAPECARDVGAALREAKEREEQAAEMTGLSRAPTADVDVLGLGGTLHPYQRAAVAYARMAPRTFVADEQGLGKTVEALAILEDQAAFPALIITTATTTPHWRRKTEEWLPGRRVTVLADRPDLFSLEAHVVVVNYERLKKFQPWLLERGFVAIVCDESHYLKTPSAQRTGIVAGLVESAGPRVRLLLTGTPVKNRPAELISQLQIIDQLEALGGIHEFRQRYVYQLRLAELNERLRATCYIRRLKRDVAKEIPSKQRFVEVLEITNRQEYERAEADVIGWISERAAEDAAWQEELETDTAMLVAEHGFVVGSPELESARKALTAAHATAAGLRASQAEALVRVGVLKRLAARGKLAAVVAWAKDFVEGGSKLLLFADSRDIQADLVAAFPGCAHILGDDTIGARQAAIDRFGSDDGCRVIVCSLKAAGIGVDGLQKSASDVAFVELGWTPAEHDQAEDRLHRGGQTDPVSAWYLLGEGTIDEPIANLIDEKRVIVTASTDGGEVEEGSLLTDLLERLRGGPKEASHG